MIVLHGARDRVEVVRFGPDGTTLVAPTYKGLQVWRDLPAGGPPELIREHKFCKTVEFTPDGRRLFVDGSGFAVRDLATNESRPVVLWGGGGCHFGLAPDGRFLVAAQNNLAGPKHHLGCRPATDLSPAATFWKHTLDRPVVSRPVFVAGGGS